ncbi:hypothetical protein AS593_07515 [Caulobacter vibrioides]|nr:hypothetical protein AS593_07515 [Caulobacter vibrioides]
MAAVDRRLRRLVADLATASPEDIHAVLSALPGPQREQAEALFTEYLGGTAPRVEADGALVVSDWLLARVHRAADAPSLRGYGDLSFGMTAHALAALNEEAERLGGVAAPSPARPKAGWLSRLRSAVLMERPR